MVAAAAQCTVRGDGSLRAPYLAAGARHARHGAAHRHWQGGIDADTASDSGGSGSDSDDEDEDEDEDGDDDPEYVQPVQPKPVLLPVPDAPGGNHKKSQKEEGQRRQEKEEEKGQSQKGQKGAKDAGPAMRLVQPAMPMAYWRLSQANVDGSAAAAWQTSLPANLDTATATAAAAHPPGAGRGAGVGGGTGGAGGIIPNTDPYPHCPKVYVEEIRFSSILLQHLHAIGRVEDDGLDEEERKNLCKGKAPPAPADAAGKLAAEWRFLSPVQRRIEQLFCGFRGGRSGSRHRQRPRDGHRLMRPPPRPRPNLAAAATPVPFEVDRNVELWSLEQTSRMIADILEEKIQADVVDDAAGNPRDSMAEFVEELLRGHFRRNSALARRNLARFVAGCELHAHRKPRVWLFSTVSGIVKDDGGRRQRSSGRGDATGVRACQRVAGAGRGRHRWVRVAPRCYDFVLHVLLARLVPDIEQLRETLCAGNACADRWRRPRAVADCGGGDLCGMPGRRMAAAEGARGDVPCAAVDGVTPDNWTVATKEMIDIDLACCTVMQHWLQVYTKLERRCRAEEKKQSVAARALETAAGGVAALAAGTSVANGPYRGNNCHHFGPCSRCAASCAPSAAVQAAVQAAEQAMRARVRWHRRRRRWATTAATVAPAPAQQGPAAQRQGQQQGQEQEQEQEQEQQQQQASRRRAAPITCARNRTCAAARTSTATRRREPPTATSDAMARLARGTPAGRLAPRITAAWQCESVGGGAKSTSRRHRRRGRWRCAPARSSVCIALRPRGRQRSGGRCGWRRDNVDSLPYQVQSTARMRQAGVLTNAEVVERNFYRAKMSEYMKRAEEELLGPLEAHVPPEAQTAVPETELDGSETAPGTVGRSPAGEAADSGTGVSALLAKARRSGGSSGGGS